MMWNGVGPRFLEGGRASISPDGGIIVLTPDRSLLPNQRREELEVLISAYRRTTRLQANSSRPRPTTVSSESDNTRLLVSSPMLINHRQETGRMCFPSVEIGRRDTMSREKPHCHRQGTVPDLAPTLYRSPGWAKSEN
ncbi:hypothetical protein ElyMa_003797200 [Elysia marginata]|uniref:Uncharacterized protein n=1 Tax=Elysia marginata TaxID=1093978 RepID=A0AAV4FEQ7_9GAST|nr:hypothetical protein ElyMa_003797200 [Elysia marginata]